MHNIHSSKKKFGRLIIKDVLDNEQQRRAAVKQLREYRSCRGNDTDSRINPVEREEQVLLVGAGLGLSVSLASFYLGCIPLNLLLKLYFMNGGSRIWLSSCAQTAGWPISALAAAFLFWNNGLKFSTPISSPMTLAIFTLLGCLDAVSAFLFDLGISYLPASTSGILFSSQLAFNAGFTILIAGHKPTAFSWNAVVLSAVILALDSENDKLHENVTSSQQFLGYVMTIGAAAICGLMKPLHSYEHEHEHGTRTSNLWNTNTRARVENTVYSSKNTYILGIS